MKSQASKAISTLTKRVNVVIVSLRELKKIDDKRTLR